MEEGSIWSNILLQLVLIVINAFFAMSEIAIISVSEAKVQSLIQEGRKGARSLQKLTKVPAKFLATIQVGVTMSGFLGAAFGADNFAGPLVNWIIGMGATISPALLNTLMVVLTTIIIAFLTLVFGELVPKQIAIHKPVQISLGIASIISAFSIVLRPVVALLTVSSHAVLRLFGIDPNADSDKVSEEEIRMMVDMGGDAGTIEDNERTMISNVFELNNTTAGEVMTHRIDVVAISVDDTLDEMITIFEESGFSRFPVYEEDMDNIIGILRTRDFFLNIIKENPAPLADLLRSPHFVPETITADTLLNEMKRLKMHVAVVVDEFGGTSGIVTMEDLLEEIVGNIYDESDRAEIDIEGIGEDVYRVAGSVELEVLGELFGVDIDDDDVDTVGGLVFKILGAIPEDGSHPEVTCEGLRIQVESIEERRVLWTVVSRSKQETTGEEDDEME